jgi:hypothetical protein
MINSQMLKQSFEIIVILRYGLTEVVTSWL